MKSKKLAVLAASCSLVFTGLSFSGPTLSAKAETSLKHELEMTVSSRYDSGVQNEDGGATEIVAYNSDNQKYYVINGTTKQLEIVKLPSSTAFNTLKAEKTINLEASLKKVKPNFIYGDVTSISINTELDVIVAAVQAAGYNDNGLAVFLDYEGNLLHVVEAGKQPDMVTFTPDGKKVLVANEGEPREGYAAGVADPQGSVSVIDVSTGVTKAIAKTITFESLDGKRDSLVADGVILKKETAPSVDLEPEYIAVSADSKFAYVALQEANAIATLNLSTNEWINIKGLGFKDHSQDRNALDLLKDKTITIQPESVKGIYMPDGIATYESNGKTYIVTANEGDSRDWNGYLNENEIELNGNEVVLFDTADYDGVVTDDTYIFGGRSFSIYEADTMTQVFDSGSDLETIIAKALPEFFNASNNNTKLDNRSGKKGPEPEDVKIGQIGDLTYAFIGIERVGGVMMYDITNPQAPTFVQYVNERDFSKDIQGDVSPEGLAFISDTQSPTGLPTLLVAHEVSGTVTAFTISAPSSVTFTDIQGHWAQTAIESVTAAGLFQGVTKETFNPNAQLTRAQFVTALSRIQSIAPTNKVQFLDVRPSDYFAQPVAWASKKKLLNADTGQFKPYEPITREETAQILYRYMQVTNSDFVKAQEKQAFADDQSISLAAKEAVYALQQAGIFTGDEQQNFRPDTTLSRAETAILLHKILP